MGHPRRLLSVPPRASFTWKLFRRFSGEISPLVSVVLKMRAKSRNQLETDGFIDQRSSTRSARMWISILAMAIATSLCVSVGVTLSQQTR
jgi:hypothetical protein